VALRKSAPRPGRIASFLFRSSAGRDDSRPLDLRDGKMRSIGQSASAPPARSINTGLRALPLFKLDACPLTLAVRLRVQSMASLFPGLGGSARCLGESTNARLRGCQCVTPAGLPPKSGNHPQRGLCSQRTTVKDQRESSRSSDRAKKVLQFYASSVR